MTDNNTDYTTQPELVEEKRLGWAWFTTATTLADLVLHDMADLAKDLATKVMGTPYPSPDRDNPPVYVKAEVGGKRTISLTTGDNKWLSEATARFSSGKCGVCLTCKKGEPADRECVIGYVGELRKLTADQVRELADDGCRGWNGVLNRILAAAGAL